MFHSKETSLPLFSLKILGTFFLFLIGTNQLWGHAFVEEKALVFRPSGVYFDRAFLGLKEKLEEDVSVIDVDIANLKTTDKWLDVLRKELPKVIVVMGNSAINDYLEMRKANPHLKLPPTIFFMAVFVDNLMWGYDNIVGIRYEIPAVTSLVHFRSIYKKEVNKVGVIHREGMEAYLEQQRKMCTFESIELVPKAVPNSQWNLTGKVRKAINTLIEEDKVDALWILNDSTLLSANLLIRAWQPLIKKHHIPVIVGVQALAAQALKFGVFAVQPDHYALGSQAADIVLELKDDQWKMESSQTLAPLSVHKTLNLELGQDLLGENQFENLGEIDKVITQ